MHTREPRAVPGQRQATVDDGVRMSATESISLDDVPQDVVDALLTELGYHVDRGLVFYEDDEPYIDPYVGVQVRSDNVMVLPGSTVVLDANPVSAAGYIQDYGDPFEDGEQGA